MEEESNVAWCRIGREAMAVVKLKTYTAMSQSQRDQDKRAIQLHFERLAMLSMPSLLHVEA
jgi:hypothetical protein